LTPSSTDSDSDSPDKQAIGIKSDLPWHAMTVAEVAETLDSESGGLDSAEVRERRHRYGPNRLKRAKSRGPLLRFLKQFNNILLYVMMGSAVITAFLEHWIDTAVLLGAVITNAIIGFIQEGKAENALDAIRGMLSPRATVIRGGRQRVIDAADLVPGDQVLLASGDRVPADVRLITVKSLRVDEAALTGESQAISKISEPVAPDSALGDRRCMAYSGTVVVYGQARGIVVATAADTEIGRIDRMLSEVESVTTPLLRQIDRFGKILALVILVMAVATYVLGTMGRGQPASDMFMMVVALVASAIPEGLPAIMTVTLALGVQRMARRNAIVRLLPAVETLGSVTVICSDKTGTLTRNEMTVQRFVMSNRSFDISGTGYEPVGQAMADGHPVEPKRYPVLCLAVRAGMLCNDARLHNDGGDWTVEGDPTEGALLVLGRKLGMGHDEELALWPRIDSIPFHQDPEDGRWIFIKGAPERIFDICTHQWSDGEEGQPFDVEHWRRLANETAAQGLRLLAIACKRSSGAGEGLTLDDVNAGGYAMLALAGIIDPPREEAIIAVRECHRAGIDVKMITGDHAATASAIGAQLDIGNSARRAVSGPELDGLDDDALRRVAAEADVFARASPEHKLRLVRALQSNGEVVAMTGDGVNDAPALKRADVGVAMGMKGTEAAKESSDMVLADDNFATIAAAVREGRAVYDNIR
jgi:magnesium-transporting ATPase (P-type)